MANVLIVDDFADYAKTAATLLRQAGHSVQVASSGEEALDACRQRRPDAVLLDIELPRMSGHDLAKCLHDEFGAATPRLIAITGYSKRDDRRLSANAGIDMHFVKPVDFNHLRAILDKPSAIASPR
jgi:CheY-like chemotaxis protein